MRRLCVGIIGFGYFGKVHYEVLSRIENVEVVAISEINPSAFDKYPLPDSIRRYTDPAQLIAENSINLLDVVTTEETHYSLVALGLKNNLDVIVEKPFTQSSEHARELIETARRAGRQLYVGQILRFDSRYLAVHESLHTKNQPIRHISLQRHFTAEDHVIYGRIDPFLVSCVHDIDLSIWLCSGRPIRRVFAATQNWLRRENPDVAIGILEWEDGLRAVMQNIWHLSGGPYGDDMETKIFADATTYIVRNEPVVQIWEAQAKCTVPESFYWPFINGVRSGAISDELHHFIDCAKRQIDTPLVPLDQIQNGIDTAQALIRSAKSGRWENV